MICGLGLAFRAFELLPTGVKTCLYPQAGGHMLPHKTILTSIIVHLMFEGAGHPLFSFVDILYFQRVNFAFEAFLRI